MVLENVYFLLLSSECCGMKQKHLQHMWVKPALKKQLALSSLEPALLLEEVWVRKAWRGMDVVFLKLLKVT